MEVGRELRWKAEGAEPGSSHFNQECPGYAMGWLGSESQTRMIGQMSRFGVGVKCPPAGAANSATYRINLASFGTSMKGSWVFGECFLADVYP